MTFIKKEFLHIFRDGRTLLILFGMPVAQVFLFGFAVTNEVSEAKIAIWDKSGDYYSQQLTSKVLSSGYFQMTDQLYSSKQIDEAFRKGTVKVVLVFPENFNEQVEDRIASVQIIADATDPNMANILSNYIQGIVGDFQQTWTPKGVAPQINTEVRMHYNPELKGVFLFVPGVITIILMLISAMLTSIAITREKELGTMEVLLASPLKPVVIILGKVVPYMALSFLNGLIVLALGIFVFGMPMNGSFVLLLAEMLLFVICALSLGILISTKTDSQQTAMMISLFALMLPTILLSGFIFPISSMPWPLQVLSNAMPPKWFIIIIKGIMLKGVGIEVLWKETLILAGMTFFFIMVSVKNFKTRLE